jgi:hypothetical protein
MKIVKFCKRKTRWGSTVKQLRTINWVKCNFGSLSPQKKHSPLTNASQSLVRIYNPGINSLGICNPRSPKTKSTRFLTDAFQIYYGKVSYTENEVPQPQVLAALGLLKVKPRAFSPS